jgi:hypothetical protein
MNEPAPRVKLRGRPILGAISGLLFGLFAALMLVFEGLLPLNNNMLAIYPVAGLLLGLIIGIWGPFARKRHTPPVAPLPTAPVVPPPPTPAAGEEPMTPQPMTPPATPPAEPPKMETPPPTEPPSTEKPKT